MRISRICYPDGHCYIPPEDNAGAASPTAKGTHQVCEVLRNDTGDIVGFHCEGDGNHIRSTAQQGPAQISGVTLFSPQSETVAQIAAGTRSEVPPVLSDSYLNELLEDTSTLTLNKKHPTAYSREQNTIAFDLSTRSHTLTRAIAPVSTASAVAIDNSLVRHGRRNAALSASFEQVSHDYARARAIISQYPQQKEQREALCFASAALIASADENVRAGQDQQAKRDLDKVSALLEVALTVGLAVILPEAAAALSAVALWTGRSPFTGELLSPLGRALEVANLLTLSAAGCLVQAGKALRLTAQRGGHAGQWSKKALTALQDADRAAQAELGVSAQPALGATAEIALKKRLTQVFTPKPTKWKAKNFGENWPGTSVPRGFELQIGRQSYRVHPGATKHLPEYLIESRKLGHQYFPITPLARAVEKAATQGLRPGRNAVTVEHWELGIDVTATERVVYHAVFRP